MSQSERPLALRRSALFAPGSNARALGKLHHLDCDVAILDLEDAVTPWAKSEARQAVQSWLRERSPDGPEVVVRINALGTEWGALDLQAMIAARPDAILLPKVESPAEILALAQQLPPEPTATSLRIWAMLETAKGVLQAPCIASCHARLECLVIGPNDLAHSLGVPLEPSRAALLTCLQWCVLAARANGLCILDGVPVTLHDPMALLAECQQARSWGFDGKTLVHPNQLDVCNTVFAPTELEQQRARTVILAHAKARDERREVTVVDGRIIEQLHVRDAERCLAMAALAAKRAHQDPSSSGNG